MLPDDKWFEILAQAPVQGTDTLKCNRFSSVDIPSNDVTYRPKIWTSSKVSGSNGWTQDGSHLIGHRLKCRTTSTLSKTPPSRQWTEISLWWWSKTSSPRKPLQFSGWQWHLEAVHDAIWNIVQPYSWNKGGKGPTGSICDGFGSKAGASSWTHQYLTETMYDMWSWGYSAYARWRFRGKFDLRWWQIAIFVVFLWAAFQ